MTRHTLISSLRSTAYRSLLVFALSLLGVQIAYAQHVMSFNSNSSVELESQPKDDEVFESSPRELMLRFSTYVRLVKLTVQDPSEKFINIGFLYHPDASRVFFLDLPELPPAPYYTVSWAGIDPENLMARGSFNFSFGPNAVPASTLVPKEQPIIPAVIIPDYRLVDPGL